MPTKLRSAEHTLIGGSLVTSHGTILGCCGWILVLAPILVSVVLQISDSGPLFGAPSSLLAFRGSFIFHCQQQVFRSVGNVVLHMCSTDRNFMQFWGDAFASLSFH